MAYDEALDGEEMLAAEKGDDKVLQLELIAEMGIDLAQQLPESTLDKVAQRCMEGYERDKADRTEWEADYEKIAALVRGDREGKTFPWAGASNVKYPLIMTATMQFGSRAYPAIIKGMDVVKTRVNGEDPEGMKRERGDRVAGHMNWQLIEDMPEWETDTDKLVHMLPWAGCVFRQIIWDDANGRPLTSLISARNLVVSQSAKDLETVPLFTKEFELFPHEITERMRDKRYLECDLSMEGETEQEEQEMLECHCRYDLDEDGYDEPYIAVIHKETGKLLSLKAGFWPADVTRGEDGRVTRVKRDREFIKYDFMPDPEGKFLGIGFGFLLKEHNEVINTLLNQMIDAGTDEITGGGFIGRGVNLKGGNLSFEPGEWKQINTTGATLRESIVPRPTAKASPVLFQLLGVMIDAGKEVASIRDVLTGENQQANQPATTTLAIIEQGLQVFSSIYKRIYRSLGNEMKRLFKLNGAYLSEEAYYRVLDEQKAVAREDYASGDFDVAPVADPSVTTSAQRLARAEALGGFLGQPGVDNREIQRRQLEAIGAEDVDAILPPKEEGQPEPPPPEVQAEQAKMQLEQQKMQSNLQMQQQKMQADQQMQGAKLQSEQQAAQAEMALKERIETQRIQMEDARKRDQMAAEFELKREQMAMEMQLKREAMQLGAAVNTEMASDIRPGGAVG